MTTSFFVVLLMVLFLPLLILFWATESRHTRIKRLKRTGYTWKQIASRYGCCERTAQRWAVK
tara:strand:+ start:29194 stop:29379 length:186 start_codon:yes stop_codon:yes gene_type:complete